VADQPSHTPLHVIAYYFSQPRGPRGFDSRTLHFHFHWHFQVWESQIGRCTDLCIDRCTRNCTGRCTDCCTRNCTGRCTGHCTGRRTRHNRNLWAAVHASRAQIPYGQD
jgi:hypothetical protein